MQIVNIVASGDLHQKISLPELKEQLGDCMRYDTAKYHGGYIDLEGIKATIYASGKYIFTGVKSYEDVRVYYKRLSDILSAYLDSSLFTEPTVKNIVAVHQYPHEFNLHALFTEKLVGLAEFEPEVFPSIIWKVKGKGSVLIFSSGKVVYSGAKSLELLEELHTFVKERVDTKLSFSSEKE